MSHIFTTVRVILKVALGLYPRLTSLGIHTLSYQIILNYITQVPVQVHMYAGNMLFIYGTKPLSIPMVRHPKRNTISWLKSLHF